MTVYIGVDFHARQQTISCLTTEDGEMKGYQLNHEADEVKEFYRQFKGKVIVGLEASGYIEWFEEMILDLGHEVWVGDAAEIRRKAPRRQKNDRRDSELILELMVRGDFPRVHRQSQESRMVLRQVRYRHRLVKLRTIARNSVQAMAVSSGRYFGKRVYTQRDRQQLGSLPPIIAEQAERLIEITDSLTLEIKRVEGWLSKQAQDDERVMRLQTHPGVGLLTSLVLVHTLWPVERFANSKKVTAYLGLDPVEDSSGSRVRIGSISKQGSRLARFLVIEAAGVAARYDKDLKNYYQRLAERRDKPKAKVAVGRKLLTHCFILLRDGIDYDEFLRRGVEARSSRLSR